MGLILVSSTSLSPFNSTEFALRELMSARRQDSACTSLSRRLGYRGFVFLFGPTFISDVSKSSARYATRNEIGLQPPLRQLAS
jgi:hypothetical protein